MRRIERTGEFKRDYKRIKANPRHRNTIDPLLSALLDRLVADIPLPDHHRDHALIGDWRRFRECHVKPDLLLIYCLPDDSTLQLARIGTHSELF
jgi:mRNA interferase YafQ